MNTPLLRNTLISLALITASLAGVSLLSCSTAPVVAGGSGTGVGNGMITGKVCYADNSPTRGATVRLRTITYLADTSGIVSTLQNDTVAATMTVADGSFVFETVQTGKTYSIEVVDSTRCKQGTLFRVPVPTAEDVSLPSRVVTPVKILIGKVIVSGMPKNAYVLIYGLERLGKTDSHGRFFITDLPVGECDKGECKYKLLILVPDRANVFKSIESQLEVAFDPQGKIKKVVIAK
jgi:hypothetical protein